MRLQILAQHDKFLSSAVLPILHDKLRFCITEKRSSWVTCMTDLRVMPDKHDKHEFFQTQTFLQLILLVQNPLPIVRCRSCCSRSAGRRLHLMLEVGTVAPLLVGSVVAAATPGPAPACAWGTYLAGLRCWFACRKRERRTRSRSRFRRCCCCRCHSKRRCT